MPRIPDIPGTRVPSRSDQDSWLKDHVARLCQVENRNRFPGSQPVSFTKADLGKLETQDFWVCEKSDGIRVLLLVQTDTQTKNQEAYLIDRKNDYYQLSNFYFPHHRNPSCRCKYYRRWRTCETMRFLAFDCLVIDGENVMARPLDKRYGRLQDYFYRPFAKMKKDHPQVTTSHPFDIRVKQIQFSYAAELVFAEMVNLQHGSDGLIYTCVSTPYTPATDVNISFFVPAATRQPAQPDFHAKPVFLLQVWCGDTTYEQYDQMYVDDDEWESKRLSFGMKSSGEQYDDRIVEVHWDPAHNHWRMMRFRDDKDNGNHRSIVEKIIVSIADGVEKDILLERSNSIRTAWKARASSSGAGNSHAQAPGRGGAPGNAVPQHAPAPPLELRYGRLATSQWSKVGGPPVVAGMKR
ncbi:mRNA capping enzyme, alpha subunit [Mycena galopus ATCC 62051]|nr:mRNA capping enzyme, alpha subunit [Mycena galopus ATCC 62051]